MPSANITCPCCGHIVFEERGNWEICPICYWEDDPVQVADPWFRGGANTPCLADAQQNFSTFGAMEERFTEFVRSPVPTDLQDPDWRPVQVIDKKKATTPTEIENRRDAGESIPYEYWKRASA
jgi:hypothetical protein